MKLSAGNKQQIEGLRERKKAKTRAEVQKQALRLFRKKGYDNTTVEQIAEAAEVSPSTFFRYFSTKEDVVMYNIIDPVIIEALKAQPVGLSPIQAVRVAIKSAYDGFTAEESADLQERTRLMRKVPELRAKMLDKLTQNLEVLIKLTAERVGRSADDFAVRTFAGAVIGVIISVLFHDDENIKANLFKHIDAALTQLEAGLPL
jgi:AcrR family transcriptional regulator